MMTTRCPGLSPATRLSLALLIAALICAPIAAAEKEGEIGFQSGFMLPDRELTGEAETLEEVEGLVGLRAGYHFADRWSWFVDGHFGAIEIEGVQDLDTLSGRTGFEHFFRPHWRPSQWFIGFGGGVMKVEPDIGMDFDRPFASLSLGQRFRLGERFRMRWEFRGDRTLDDDEGPVGEDLTTAQAMIGITWGLGVRKIDTDGDGVSDGRDDCPNTPRGAQIDERGCPLDSDGDGVFDGLDRCPETRSGWSVDAEGCPRDTDGDGVHDGIDACAGTPSGAQVNETGCPVDSDGDGVADGLDRCADTPRGARVDASGCPRDTDGDGVVDGIDRCARTPQGAEIDATGCPKDDDGDGVPNGIDQCPSTPANTPVKPDGCPRAAQLFDETRRSLVLEGVNFETNSAVLTVDSRTILDRVAASLRDWPEVEVEIGGHTDSTGPAEYNQTLSQQRAQAVKDYLVSRGVLALSLSVRGYGEDAPLDSNATAGGRARNRRVELKKTN